MRSNPQSNFNFEDDFDASMRRYQSATRAVKAPAELKKAVLARACGEEASGKTNNNASEHLEGTKQPKAGVLPISLPGHSFTKRIKITFYIGLAAALLCAGTIAGWAISSEWGESESINDKAEPEKSLSEQGADTQKQDAESPSKAQDKAASGPFSSRASTETIPVLSKGFGLGGYCGTGYDPETDRFLDHSEWSGFKFRFDPVCTGDGIETITYELVGEHAYFELIAPLGDNTTSVFPPNNPYGATPGRSFFYTKQVTFDYDKQGFMPDGIVHSIYLRFPVSSEEAELEEGILDGTYPNTTDDQQASTRLTFLKDWGAAQELAKNNLKMTLTFADGSQDTKTLIITPVDDFKDKLTEYLQRENVFSKEYSDIASDDFGRLAEAEKAREQLGDPKLYTITKVSE